MRIPALGFIGLRLVVSLFLGLKLSGGEPPGALANSGSQALYSALDGRVHGLFVGVNTFADPALTALKFAVNDAVSLAHYFVIKARLIRPEDCTLLLSGETVGDDAKRKLQELGAAGVGAPQKASRQNFFNQILSLSKAKVASEDLLIATMSTHGFTEPGTMHSYIMPEDGYRALLSDQAVNLTSLQSRIAKTTGLKKMIFFVDACRSNASTGEKGPGDSGMQQAFAQAFAEATGVMALYSCSANQVSYEDDELKHGVFTHALLQGFAGAAKADSRGHITLGTMDDFVAAQTEKWVKARGLVSASTKYSQSSLSGPSAGRMIPIAISEASQGQLRTLEDRRTKALSRLARIFTEQPSVISALNYQDMHDLLRQLPAEVGASKATKLTTFVSMVEGLPENNMESAARLLLAWWKFEGSGFANGHLRVESLPAGATVTVDDAKLGTTPANFEVRPGKRTLKLELAGYAPVVRSVEIKPASAVEVGRVVLEKQLPQGAAPRLLIVDPPILREDERVQFAVRADHAPETFEMAGLPDGLACDPRTGVVSGVPKRAGRFPVTVTAKNSFGADQQRFTLRVDEAPVPQVKPVVTDARVEIAERESFEHPIEVTSGENVTLTVGTLPPGVKFDRTTATLSGTPRAGTHTIAISATNSAGTGRGRLTIVVKPAVPENKAVYHLQFATGRVLSVMQNGDIVDSFGQRFGRSLPPTALGTVAVLDMGMEGYYHLGSAPPYAGLIFALLPDGIGGFNWYGRGMWRPNP